MRWAVTLFQLVLQVILFFCFYLQSVGQTEQINKKKTNPYAKVPELQLLKDTDNVRVISIYQLTAGFEGQTLDIRPDCSFSETFYNCDIFKPTNTGIWTFNQGRLLLTTGKTSYYYELVVFRDILFLVSPAARKVFIKEFRTALKWVKQDKQRDPKIRFSADVLHMMRLLCYHRWFI